jgi:hypothetical protein
MTFIELLVTTQELLQRAFVTQGKRKEDTIPIS